MSLVKLEEKIINTFSPMWGFNDGAHRIEHFSEVYQTALEINSKLKLGQDRKLLMFSAYFHDLFAWSRENHHLLSEEFIRGTCHELIVNNLNKEERKIVAGACRHPRASHDSIESRRGRGDPIVDFVRRELRIAGRRALLPC